MFEVVARFIGEDGSMGYEHGMLYRLKVQGNAVVEPTPCPYSTIEGFLKNWSVPLMGWGEERSAGNVGTTGQVEDAHRALDECNIEPGPLATRAWKAALDLKAYKREAEADGAALRRADL
jgi:hypothetical protein